MLEAMQYFPELEKREPPITRRPIESVILLGYLRFAHSISYRRAAMV